MNAACQLRHKIAFDQRVASDDGMGNRQADWQQQFQVRAAVRAKLGGEAVTAARLAGQQPVLITVRQSSATNRVTPDWRARDARTGAEYAIRSIVDPDGAGQWWEMLCQTGVAP